MSATATTLTIEWTHPGDGGSPLTRNFIEYRVEGTTDWTNWYRGETPTPVTRTVIRNLAAATAYDVRVHSRNAIGNSQWTQSATAFRTLAGTAATGAPTISGTLHVGRTQTASPGTIADANGLTNASYSYQWVRVDADGTSNEEDITDATDARVHAGGVLRWGNQIKNRRRLRKPKGDRRRRGKKIKVLRLLRGEDLESSRELGITTTSGDKFLAESLKTSADATANRRPQAARSVNPNYSTPSWRWAALCPARRSVGVGQVVLRVAPHSL